MRHSAVPANAPNFVKNVTAMMMAGRGDELPDIARLGAWRAPDAITNPDVLLDRILGR